jgi:CheY-like chemotaxis protein
MSDPVSRSLIVLAEDNADLRKLLADGLERVGFAVVRAENSADLIEKYSRSRTTRSVPASSFSS